MDRVAWWCQRKFGLALFRLSIRVYPGIADTVAVLAEAMVHERQNSKWQ